MEKVLIALITAVSTAFGAVLVNKRNTRKETSQDKREDVKAEVEADSAVVQLYFAYAQHAEDRVRELETKLAMLQDDCADKDRDKMLLELRNEYLAREITRLREAAKDA